MAKSGLRMNPHFTISAFENESGLLKVILSPGNRWLAPNSYLRIFGKKFIKGMGFDVNKSKIGTKSKIPKKRMEQIEQYVDEIDDNTKQFARELNDLPTSEDNQDNIMLQYREIHYNTG